MPGSPYTIHLDIGARYRGTAYSARLRSAARAVLTHCRAPAPGEVSIRIAGDALLRRLNREYMGYDQPTDVLSFPSADVDPDSRARYFGDIAISLPRARAQADEAGHPLRAELQLLVVHGILHLLGYDHTTPTQKRRMWKVQEAILRQVGAGIAGPAL